MGLYEKHKITKNNHNSPMEKEDGTYAQNLQGELETWEKWTQKCFTVSSQANQPQITHIQEETWTKLEQAGEKNTKHIRRPSNN